MEKMKSNKGITLVALIITVIILLILSAITIDIAIDGKLFDRSKETVSEANNKLGEEQNRVDSLVNEWDNLETGTSGNTSGNEPEDTTPPTVEVEIERTTSNSMCMLGCLSFHFHCLLHLHLLLHYYLLFLLMLLLLLALWYHLFV